MTANAWASYLTDTELPVFARTVSDVSQIAGDPRASAQQLAETIMKDAAMAARLLKVANSPLFITRQGRVQTIERGVVLLGFDAVREMAISLAVIEQALRGGQRAPVLAEMALAFHTATQSEMLARLCNDAIVAETFLAGLLYRIGLLAFLACADTRVPVYVRERAPVLDDPPRLQQLERQLLGCDMAQLSRRLAQDWSLGAVLRQALTEPSDPVAERIATGRAIAEAVARHGWDSAITLELLAGVAKKLDLPPADLLEQAQRGAEAARAMARKFGADQIVALIPAGQAAPEPAARRAPVTYLNPDPLIHIEMFGRMTEQMTARVALGQLIRTAIEGIHRGLGMDRTIFGLLNSRRDRIRARYVLAEPAADNDGLREAFDFDLEPASSPLLASVIRHHRSFWIHADCPSADRVLLRGAFAAFVGGADFLIQPVLFGEHCVGLLHADRALSRRPLDSSANNGFRQFGQQLALGLRMLKMPSSP